MAGETVDYDFLINRAVQLQRSFWTFNGDEKESLLSRFPDLLSWTELFRLLQLTCLEFSTTNEGRTQLMNVQLTGNLDAPAGFTYDLCKELIERLISKESPYRARPCYVWQGKAGQSSNISPDLYGKLRNASVTHLGCLEVIHLDEDGLPTRISFIPFDDIEGIIYSRPSLFRFAKLLYKDARDIEIVLVPLLYGISWFTANEIDHNGSMTRFYCSMLVEGLDCKIGIGVGHQDFLLSGFESGEGGDTLFGMGSVSKIMTG